MGSMVKWSRCRGGRDGADVALGTCVALASALRALGVAAEVVGWSVGGGREDSEVSKEAQAEGVVQVESMSDRLSWGRW
jgi:hypothetical protein